MPKFLKLIGLVAVALFCLGAAVQPAQAGTVILEGSDAIGFHAVGGNPGAITYRDQAWTAIGGSDPRPIGVIGTDATGGSSGVGSGTHPIMQFADLTAAGSLSNYVALYFLATDGCCTENDALPAGHEADITAYLAAGGTVMIENYIGGAAWDFAVGTGGAGNAHVGGIGGGAPNEGAIAGCDDGETVTADGLANGFTQPPAMGCWTHQGYDQAFFGPLGFTHNFFDSPPDYNTANPPPAGPWSSLLSNGRTVTGTTPEPSSIALLCIGSLSLLGYGVRRRMRVA